MTATEIEMEHGVLEGKAMAYGEGETVLGRTFLAPEETAPGSFQASVSIIDAQTRDEITRAVKSD